MTDEIDWDRLGIPARRTGPPGSEHMSVREQYGANAYFSHGERLRDERLQYRYGINRTEGGLRGLAASGLNLGLSTGQLLGTLVSFGQWDTSIDLPDLLLNKEQGERFDLANLTNFRLRGGRLTPQELATYSDRMYSPEDRVGYSTSGGDPYLRKFQIDHSFTRSHTGPDGEARPYITWDALPANKRRLFVENVKTPRQALQFFESMSGEYWKQNLIQQHNLGFWSSMSNEFVAMGSQQEYFAEDLVLFGFFNWGRRVVRIGQKGLELSRVPVAFKMASDGSRIMLKGAEATAAVASGQATMLVRGGRVLHNLGPGSGAGAQLMEANYPGQMLWKQQLAAAGMFVGIDQARVQTMTMQKNLLLDREEIGKYIAFSAAYGVVGSSLVRWQINSMHKTSETARHIRTWDRLMGERLDKVASDGGLPSRASVPDDVALDEVGRLFRDMQDDAFKEFGEQTKATMPQWLWARVFRYADTIAEGSPSPVYRSFVYAISDSMAQRKIGRGAGGSFVSATGGFETSNQAVGSTLKRVIDSSEGPMMPAAATMDGWSSHHQGMRIIVGEIATDLEITPEKVEAAVRQYASRLDWEISDSQLSSIVKSVGLFRDRLSEANDLMFIAGGVNANFVDPNNFHAIRLWLLDAIDAKPAAFQELIRASLVKQGVDDELAFLSKQYGAEIRVEDLDDATLAALRQRLSIGTPAVAATADVPAQAARKGAIRDAEEIAGGLTGVSLNRSSPHGMQGISSHRSRGIRIPDDFETEWLNPETGLREMLRVSEFINSDPLHILEHMSAKLGPALFSAVENAEPMVKEFLLSAAELFNAGNFAGAHNKMVAAQIAEILSNTGQGDRILTFKRSLDALDGLSAEHQQVLGDNAAWFAIGRDLTETPGESVGRVTLHPQTEGYRSAEALLLDFVEGLTGSTAWTARIEKAKRLSRLREEQYHAIRYKDEAGRWDSLPETLPPELDDLMLTQGMSVPGVRLVASHPIVSGTAQPKTIPRGSTPLKEVENALEAKGATKHGEHWMLPIDQQNPSAGYVMLELNAPNGRVSIDYIHVVEELRRKGHAARAMDLITEVADEYGFPVHLVMDTTATKKSVLLKFYKKHGFKRKRLGGTLQDSMVRTPSEGVLVGGTGGAHIPGGTKFDDVASELHVDNKGPNSYGNPREVQDEIPLDFESGTAETRTAAADFDEYSLTTQPGPLPVNAGDLPKVRVRRADGRLSGEGRGVWTKAEVLAAREAAHTLYFYLPKGVRTKFSDLIGGIPEDILLSHSGLGHVVPKKARNNSEAFMEGMVRWMAGDEELVGFAEHATDLPALKAFFKEHADGFRVRPESRAALDIRRGKLPKGTDAIQQTAKDAIQVAKTRMAGPKQSVKDMEEEVRKALHAKGDYEELPIGPMQTEAEAALARVGVSEATGQPRRVTSKQSIDSMLRDIVAIMQARGTGRVVPRAELEAVRARVNPSMEVAIDRLVALDATRTGYEDALHLLNNVQSDVNEWLYKNSKVHKVWGTMLFDDMKYRKPLDDFLSAFDAGTIHEIDPQALKGGIVKAGQKQYDRAKEWQWTGYRMMKDWTERFGEEASGRAARETQLDMFKDTVNLIHRRTGLDQGDGAMNDVNKYFQKILYGIASVPMSFTQINDIASPMFVLGMREWATGYMPEFMRSIRKFKKETGMSWQEMSETFEAAHHYATMDGLNHGLGPGRVVQNPVTNLRMGADFDPYPLATGIPKPLKMMFEGGEAISAAVIELSMHQIVARTRISGGHAARKLLFKYLKSTHKWSEIPVNKLQRALILGNEQVDFVKGLNTRTAAFRRMTLTELTQELDLNPNQIRSLNDAVNERGSLQQVLRDLKKGFISGEDYGLSRLRQMGFDAETSVRLAKALDAVDYEWEKLPMRWRRRVRTAIVQFQNNMNPVPTITNTAKWHRGQWGQLVFAFMRFLTAAPSRHLPNAMQRGGVGAALAAHAGTTTWSFMIEGILRPLAKGEGVWDGWEKPFDQWENKDWAVLLRIINGNAQYGFLPETFSAFLSGHDRSRLAAYAAAYDIGEHFVKSGKALFSGELGEAAKEIGLGAGGVFGLGALETAWKQTKAWRED